MGVQLNEDKWWVVSKSIDVASVAANTSAEQAFTVTGVRVGDFVAVSKPSLSAGLIISTARVSATDTVAITFGNLTGSPIDPAAETYLVKVFRPEKTYSVVPG
jgi:hypothetical protein